MTLNASRRNFLQHASAFSALGAAAPLGINLSLMNSAVAQTTSDYKALVCVFLLGGSDTANVVLPTDSDSWGRYIAARNVGSAPIALAPVGASASGPLGSLSALGGVLPIRPKTAQAFPAGTRGTGARSFALHPSLSRMQGLFNSGQLAVVPNVGSLTSPTTKAQYTSRLWKVPKALFSHSDQQNQWQTGVPENAPYGWAGLMGDLFASGNSTPGFTSIATATASILVSGRTVNRYQVGYDYARKTAAAPINYTTRFPFLFQNSVASVVPVVTRGGSNSLIAKDYASIVARSMQTEQVVNSALSGSTVTPPGNFTNPIDGRQSSNLIATQLHAVAQFIQARSQFGIKRQVFYVGIFGFDTHSNQLAVQTGLMAQLDHALGYFYDTLKQGLGTDMTNNVTTFTMSDFGRTLATNGDGTDHGWGSHQFVMGGAVKGGDFYNQFPTIGIDLAGFDNPDAISGGVLIPTVAVSQYAATLGAWFGVAPGDLKNIFPTLGNFGQTNLGFMA